METKKCPRCGIKNDDDWPISIDGVVNSGGCQDCWEDESDRAWWKEIEKLAKAGLIPTTIQAIN